MYGNLKKMLSFLMVMAMLVTMLPISVSAQSMNDAPVRNEYTEPVATVPPMPTDPMPTAPTIPTGPSDPMPTTPVATEPTTAPAEPTVPAVTYDVEITEPWESVEFTFTPTQSGVYKISTNGTQTKIHIFDEDGFYVIEAYAWDFLRVYQYLEQGRTYTLNVGYESEKTGAFQLLVEFSPLQSITCTPITVMEGTCGSTESEWNPETGEWDLEYYSYSLWSLFYRTTYTATFNDGTVLTGSDPYFEYGGEVVWFNFYSHQDYNNQWSAGNTYTFTVEVMGIETEIPVTIMPTPLKSITFEPVEIMEGTCGAFCHDWNEETNDYDREYYVYEAWQMLGKTTYTATFNDGTVLKGSGTGFEYNGEYFNFNYSTSEQFYGYEWAAGNTYFMYVDIMGIHVEIPVTIKQTPLQSITFTPVTVVENTNGEYCTDYNPETGNYDLEYFSYYEWRILQMSHYTVVFKDGTVIEGTDGNGFEYQDNWYSFSYVMMDQSGSNQLTVGNTYNMSVSITGWTSQIEIPVTIKKSPIVNVTFDPITMDENSDGYWMSYYDSESGAWKRYFVYHWWNKLSYTVTMDDGTSVSGTGSSINYDGVVYGISFEDNQEAGPEYCWTSGSTHTVTVSAMGHSAQVEVTIGLPPIESITFDPVELVEEQGGAWYIEWDWETQTDIRYYHYDWVDSVTYTITFRDGTVMQVKGRGGVEYNGKYYHIDNYTDDQRGSNPWKAGQSRYASVWIEGVEYSVYITVSAATEDNGYEYLIQNGKAIITNCTMQTEILQIPATLGGYPVAGITGLGDALLYAKQLRIPDSVTMMSSQLLTPSHYGNREIPLEYLSIGSGVSVLDGNDLKDATRLKQIDVSANNPWMKSVDGVLYDADLTVLLAFPAAKEELHVIPDSVTNIDIFFRERDLYAKQFANPNIKFGAGITDYKMVDGVIYNADMTTVLLTTPAAKGDYKMPQSVTNIGSFAFIDSDLTSVEISPNVTEITYQMFDGHILLEEITIPSSVTAIHWTEGYSNLNKVNITDLEHWISGIEFWNNPLRYAHNLYLNGKKIVDLVIPQSVDKINDYAFQGGSFESVVLPAKALQFGYNAFAECENLKGVYISDMAAWVSNSYYYDTSNPLYYARDLYLNGKKVVNLVLPESDDITEITSYAFTNASFESVTIPDNIRSIGQDAFYGCDNLQRVNVSDLEVWCNINFTSETANPLYYARDLYLNGSKITELVIPDTVNRIGYHAFYNGSMTSVSIPASVEEIWGYAFANSAVENVQFSEGLISIGYDAFANSAIKKLYLPNSLVELSGSAFANCADLQTVIFGNKLKNIGYCAFEYTAVDQIALPDSLEYLGSSAFEGCTNLVSVDLGDGLTEIDSYAFAHTGLKSVTLPKQLQHVGYRTFANSKLEELIINCDSVSIYDAAFAECPLGDMEFGSNINYISSNAFEGTNATQIRLPDSVTDISYRTFAFNENLVSITIPESVKNIYEGAFEGSHNLRHVLYTGTEEQWNEMYIDSPEIWGSTIHFDAMGNEVTTRQTCTTVTFYCSICKREETVRKGKITHDFVNGVCTVCGVDSYWEYIVDDMNHTVTITEYTGTDTDVTLPDTIEGMPVTAFTMDAFAYNRSIRSVTLPDSITTIPDSAFFKCTNLREVNVGSKLVSVGTHAFCECISLSEISLPDSVKSIGVSAFYSSGLASFTFPKSLTELGSHAFYNCEITTLEIPATLTEIGMMTFADCRYLTTVIIPDSITEIDVSAFAGCTRLQTLSIGSGVRSIGTGAFADTALKLVLFYGDCPEMLENCFGDCKATAFYSANKKGWETVGASDMKWYACATPEILKQPVDTAVADGAVLAVEAYGQRLRYQWYYAKPGSDDFIAIGGDSIELALNRDEVSGGGRAYCLITDVLGQTAQTNIVNILAAAPEKVQDAKAKFATTGLSLGTFIGLQSAVMKNTLNGGKFDEAYFVYEQYSYNNDGVLELLATTRGEYIDMGSYFVSECPVNAKQMNDIYRITPYYVKDGVIYYGTATVTSVKTEAMKKVKATATDDQTLKAKALCIAMLNYGTEAQKVFNYSLKNLANAQLTAAQKALPAFDNLGLKKTNSIPTTPFKPASAGLSLGDVVYMQFLIAKKHVAADSELQYQIMGEDLVKVKVSDLETYGSYYVINVPIKAKRVRANTVIALFNAQGQRIYGYMICSVEAFAVAQKGTSAEKLVTALMTYGDAAKAMFG